MSFRIKSIFPIALIILGVSAMAPLLANVLQPKPVLPQFSTVTEFSFSDQNEQPFSRDNVAGKVWLTNLFFSSCKGPCPKMSAQLAILSKRFKHTPGVVFTSVSVDPEHDSAEVLREYAARFEATDKSWYFLRGEIEKVKQFAVEGLKIGTPDNPRLHSTRFVLVDQSGTVRGYYQSNEPGIVNKIADDIESLL